MNRQNGLDKPVKTTTKVPVPFVVVLACYQGVLPNEDSMAS